MEGCLYKGKQICDYGVTNTNYDLNYQLKNAINSDESLAKATARYLMP